MSTLRKGWCPGALTPMRSGDGLIVRLRFSCGELSAAEARDVAEWARTFGNGEIDLTARAHLQLRGVDDSAYPKLIARLAEAGLVDASPEAEAVRNVLVSPLAGVAGAFDVRPFARAWERELTTRPDLWRLPGKFSFGFDAGAIPLGDASDISFEAQDGEMFVARLAGAAQVLGPFPANQTLAVARALAQALLAGGPRRMRDALAVEGLAPFAQAAGLPLVAAPAPPPPRAAAWLGAHENFFGVAAPFGRLNANQLSALAHAAGGLRLTPWRGLLIPGADAALCAQARGLGLIVDADDPLLRVAACTGAPACAGALGETREAARKLAPLAPRGEGVWLHVSGCEKLCAHPRAAPLTAVASAAGYRLNGEAPRTLAALAERIVA